jgi:EAL domain-containing protein (putative c-di-GMP-specific phosphodiesterase class I)
VAVNVSPVQFTRDDFVEQVLSILDRTGADPRHLKLELTESLLLHRIDEVIAKMTRLKARGLAFALDDFGTGYSSLSYLHRLPLDELKIDKSFVRNLPTDRHSAAIAETIIVLGRTMGLAVLAEGVETEAERDLLIRLGCETFQGYLFGRPQPAEALPAP